MTKYQANKIAFDEIMGDPFAIPETVSGLYIRLKSRSRIPALDYTTLDEGHGTLNPTRPSIVDFFCDVENIIERILIEQELVEKFENTYILELTETIFTPQERADIEQRIGAAFLRYGISPSARYFSSVRQGSKRKKQNGNARTR